MLQQAIIVILTALCGYLSSYALNRQKETQAVKKRLQEKDIELNKKQDDKIELLMDASKTTLRIQMIEYHDKYMQKGSMPLYAKDNLIEMYSTYHAMGGNGAMTKFYNDLIALPEK